MPVHADSNLNLAKGATRANLAIVKPGDDGRVRRGGAVDAAVARAADACHRR